MKYLIRARQLFVLVFAIGVSGGWIWNAHRLSVEEPPSNDSAELEAAVQTEGADGSGVTVDDSPDEKPQLLVEPSQAVSDGAVLHVEAFAVDSGRRPTAGIRGGGSTAKQKRDRQSALMAGMFGGANSNVFGPGGLGGGNKSAIGGLQGGAGLGDPRGLGGVGSRGLGLGGLGTGFKGHGDGGGAPEVATSLEVPAGAGLSRSELEKVVKRHASEIQFCLAQTLLAEPDMMRRVALEITVDPSGSVPDAREAKPGSGPVGACIIQRVRRWKFPEPEPGSSTTFTAEWVFSAGAR